MKRIMRLSAVLLALCLLLIPFAGCGGADKYGLDPKTPVKLSVWHYYVGAQAIAFGELVDEFNNTVGEERGIVITAESKNSINDLAQAIQDSVNKKVGAPEMPNLFQSYLEGAVELDAQGRLAAYDPYITQEELDAYYDSYIQEGRFDADGNLKLFPFAKSTEVLMVNKTDWDRFASETGADINELATWEGVARVARQYYEWSGGKAFFGRDAMPNYPLCGAQQLGHPVFTERGGQIYMDLDKDTFRKLWDNFYVPYLKGYYKHAGRYRSDDIKTGEIIAALCSTSSATYFPKQVTIDDGDPVDIDFMILPVPNFEGMPKYAVQQGASMAMSKSDETHEYAASLFMKWLTLPEHNMVLCADSGYLPVQKEACDPQKITQFLQQAGVENPVITQTAQVATRQINENALFTSRAFSGGLEARNVLGNSFLEKAQADRNALMAAVETGVSEQEAIQPFLDGANFDQWHEQLENALTAIITNKVQ